MGKFIITEEEKSRILGMHKSATSNHYLTEQTTGDTQLKVINSVDAFNTLYSNGYNKINTPYNGVWYQNTFTFNGYKINVTLPLSPKSDVNVEIKLELEPTKIQRMIDDGVLEKENYDYQKLSNYKSLVFNIYDNSNKIIANFEPLKSQDYTTDNNGNKVNWKDFIASVKIMK
jgi:hypothetical protein